MTNTQTTDSQVWHLKNIYGFSDMNGNHYPRLKPGISWDEIINKANCLSPSEFRLFCAENAHPECP